jgi:hypothetical protein
MLGQLLDHLVGDGEHAWRHLDAECLCGFQIDDQLELGRLRDRQIGRFGALENFSDVDSGLTILVRKVSSITDKTALFGEITLNIDRGQLIAGGQRYKLVASGRQERILRDKERARPGVMTKASSIGGSVIPSKVTSSTAPRTAITRPCTVLVRSITFSADEMRSLDGHTPLDQVKVSPTRIGLRRERCFV